jgi:hypothetical protein
VSSGQGVKRCRQASSAKPRARKRTSFSKCETLRKLRGKTRSHDFSLSFSQIIPQPAQIEGALLFIKYDVCGPPVAISRLTDTARINEVLPASFLSQLLVRDPDYRTILDIGSRRVRMSKEAEFQSAGSSNDAWTTVNPRISTTNGRSLSHRFSVEVSWSRVH